ncbi:unnamed protein product [Calypogeia fissa]
MAILSQRSPLVFVPSALLHFLSAPICSALPNLQILAADRKAWYPVAWAALVSSFDVDELMEREDWYF